MYPLGHFLSYAHGISTSTHEFSVDCFRLGYYFVITIFVCVTTEDRWEREKYKGLKMSREKILIEYDNQLRTLNNLSHSIKSLINTLLTSENIIAHTVSSRVKEKESLSKKIDKKDKYTKLNEVTDIVGIRIITHYSDDVDKVATLLEKEFDIDDENSIDKREMLDPDRFGYLSLHYVSELNGQRLKLAEYKQFKGIKFEIQIRSILQHTWAEIEHDIGYKSKAEVPREIRRQFSRLAGLLEIADSEFVNIRSSLERYEKYVEDTILKSPESISIDKISLYNFINTNKLLKKIDSIIVKQLECKFVDIEQNDLARHIKFIEYFNIDKISDLTELLEKNKKNILKATELLMERNGPPPFVGAGVSIRFLVYVIVVKTLSKGEYRDFIKIVRLSTSMEGYFSKLASCIE